jgi:AcrR family transcriptional regulator
MARPKSEDKRQAILIAATQVFAEHGLNAPMLAVSNAARVAEGTVFTYFPTKDDLLNALYRSIKRDVDIAISRRFPRRDDVRYRLRHVWNAYVGWGIAHPLQRKIIAQIEVIASLNPQSKAAAEAPFERVQGLVEAAIIQRICRDLPPRFIVALLATLAETTIDFILQNPGNIEVYRNSGFNVLWAGITSKR